MFFLRILPRLHPIQNGSEWRPEVCQVCQCKGWVGVCEEEVCVDPHCPPTHVLHHHPQHCCPQCMPPSPPCRAGPSLFQAGEVWSPGGCEECRCLEGTVSCGRQSCPTLSCARGQVALQLPDQCCPQCVPLGRSCKVDGKMYSDGEFWSPVSCSQCQCRDGQVQCHVAHCPRLTCPTNHTLELEPGACCPACLGTPCVVDGAIYESREVWKEGPCKECVCVAGKVHCHTTVCSTLTCPPHQQPHTTKGVCCPSCVNTQGWCVLESGVRKAPNQQWNRTKCEQCVCREGEVICNKMECGGERCGPGEKLVTSPGVCCPHCAIDHSVCFHEGVMRQSGDVWNHGDCGLCSCVGGAVTCYRPSCPTCPSGSVPTTPVMGDCCPACQPLSCPADCLTCTSGQEQNCLACHEGHLLQDRKCVMKCDEGKVKAGQECVPCYSTCAQCTQDTKFHCTKCIGGLVLREGECVEDCGRGYYAEEGSCLPCHVSCSECLGPREDQCQVCPPGALLSAGTCINSCPSGHYVRDQVCEMCLNHCKLCGVEECLHCQPSYWLQDGHCLDTCSPGYYSSHNHTCIKCHQSCGRCESAGISSCTSCPSGLLLSAGVCVRECPRGSHVAGSGQECQPCHQYCAHCVAPGMDGCVECPQEGQVLVLSGNSSAGTCKDTCPMNHKLLHHTCIVPPSGCEVWHVMEASVCQKCEEGWLHQEGNCVRECSPGYFHQKKKEECLGCDPRCLTCSGPGHRSCLSCHKGATLHNRKTGAECLTKCYRRHYLAHDNTCQTCHSSCNVCTAQHNTTLPSPSFATPAATKSSSLPPEVSVCVRCKEGTLLQGHQCVPECGPGQYHNLESDSCLPCHHTCHTCHGPYINTCTTCPEGSKITSEGTCEAKGCPSGTYPGSNNTCNKCQGDCHTCTTDGSTCLTCPPSHHLLYGKCVTSCPHMFYGDASMGGKCRECHWTCEQCLGPSDADCVTCGPRMLRHGNKCLAQCHPGHYQAGNECHACPSGCSRCEAATPCLDCRAPYLLQDGTCVTSCRPGTFANVFDNICYDCGSECVECSLYECQACSPLYLLREGRCVQECGVDYFPNVEAGKCQYNVGPPTVHILAPLVVEYGRLAALNSSVLHVKDPDTPTDKLMILVVDTPSNGVLFRIKNGKNIRLKRENKFPVIEMLEGKILYEYKSSQPLYGEMRLRVSDGQFQSLSEVLSITVISLYPPDILMNDPLIAIRGQNTLVTTEILKIRDQDNPESVTVRVVDGPKHGHLSIAGEELVLFTLEELKKGVIAYTHDGSDSNSDTALLQASDEHNMINFLLKVFVVSGQRSTPVVVKNQGAVVEVGERVQISPQMLHASDIDSDDDNLVLTLLPVLHNPSQGKLALIIPLPPAPDGFYNDGWTQMDETHLVRPTNSFTQRDVREGRVWYIHEGTNTGEMSSDLIQFSVADNAHPPNILSDQSFIIRVEQGQQIGAPMAPTPGTQLGITVQAGQAVILSPAHLSFTGTEGGTGEHLVYTITHPLPPHHGSLFHLDSPGLELRQFMQSDINDMKIVYMPPLEDLGQEDKYFSFKFTVSDQRSGEANTLPEQKFTIHVTPVTGTQLLFTHQDPHLTVSRGESVVIGSDVFDVGDGGGGVQYILLELPIHGNITTQTPEHQSTIFTQEDTLSEEEVGVLEVKYQHDGSESSLDSFVLLALGPSSEASTQVTIAVLSGLDLPSPDQPSPDQVSSQSPNHSISPDQLLPESEYSQHPIKSNNASFLIMLREYDSQILSREYLHFTDPHSSDRDIVYTLVSQPLYGSLILSHTPPDEDTMPTEDRNGPWQPSVVETTLNITHKFTQANVVEGQMKFVSDREVGMKEVTDGLVFNVTDLQNNVLSNQVLTVKIEAVDNVPPKPVVNGGVMVEEGGSVVLPPTSLSITDPDTPLSRLSVLIDAPPIFGYLTDGSAEGQRGWRAGSPPIQFSVTEIEEGRIVYVQSRHRHQEPQHDSFLFHVTDGTQRSPSLRLNITIQPSDDEPPVMVGEAVLVERGGTVTITSGSLSISDADTDPADLLVKVEGLPKHGTLHMKMSADVTIKQSEVLTRGQSFTAKDLMDGLILYSHDGSRHPDDAMEVMVSDKTHETGGIVEFSVVQREPPPLTPTLLRPGPGLTLSRGGTVTITLQHLWAQENVNFLGYGRDSGTVGTNYGLDPSTLGMTYTVTGLPTSGKIEMLGDDRQTYTALSTGESFTQRDILNGHIRFVHGVDESVGRDTLSFTLRDSLGEVAMNYSLVITVVEDRSPPYLTANLRLTLPEHSAAPITHTHLAASDQEIHSGQLRFIVVKGPRHGRLELRSSPGQSVKEWRQGEMAGRGLLYHHHDTHTHLTAPTPDHFIFIVTDGSNNITGTFDVTVTPVDDALPRLLVANIRAQTGARKVISQFEVEATDADTKNELIVFTVTRTPSHGALHLAEDDDFILAEKFTMQDIYDGVLSYLHDGSDMKSDTFDVLVSDSTNTGYTNEASHSGDMSTVTLTTTSPTSTPPATTQPATVMVEVAAVESGAPLLRVNRGLTFLQQEKGKMRNFITREELEVEDLDTPPEDLHFNLTHTPDHGHLSLDTVSTGPITTFTMADVREGLVYYQLNTFSHQVTSDFFTFEVTDGQPRAVTGNDFHIQWTWVMMASREYNITETATEARIVIKRIGNLKQQSSVTCLTTGGSAQGRMRGMQNKDFTMVSEPIYFQEGEAEKHCIVPVVDDDNFEGPEVFIVKLIDPNYSLIGKPKKSVVTIFDGEDKPSIFFKASHFVVNETEGFVLAQLKRSGDVSQPVSVMCVSEDGSAVGSEPNQLSGGTDFIHRLHDESSRVSFSSGAREASCSVKIIDDPVFELSEDFKVRLRDPGEGAGLGQVSEALVTIQGPNDQSVIEFVQPEYQVSETAGNITVRLQRSGVDLNQVSSVWCATKSYIIEEAQHSHDYIQMSKQVIFNKGQENADCTINLIDDSLNPKYEGSERFIVFISAAQNASVFRSTSQTVVTISDEEDIPSIEFALTEIVVRENETAVKIPVERSGDLSQVSSVHCFTRQRSAKGGTDFIERPNSEDSAIVFPKGISRTECEVGLLDDLVYEKEEKFIVKLSHPESPSSLRPHIGKNKMVRVTIQDWEDRPRVSLQQGAYTVAEPHPTHPTGIFTLPVVRLGDTTQASRATLVTQDGTAKDGEDYQHLEAVVEFAPGDTMVKQEIKLVYNPTHQRHKSFTVTLRPGDSSSLALGSLTSTTITLLPHASTATSVLPAPPLVTSFLHLENIKEHLNEPVSPSHPLVCVTPCDHNFPEIQSTAKMCAEAGLNSTSIRYSWEVAFPADGDGTLTPFHPLTDDTVFASAHTKVLDPMFFARYFRVRCVAQPVQTGGLLGIPLRSEPVSIDGLSGVCQTSLLPGQLGGYQSQSFTATLTYINSTDQYHPNTVRVLVEIPHQDGMVPLLSTLPVHNVRHLLTEQLYRMHHTCSNLHLGQGFMAEEPQHLSHLPSDPNHLHQLSKENKTEDLYHHLDLSRCVWTFNAWFTLSQLAETCGGQVISHFKVSSGGQSFLTVRVPLYVSYVTATAPPGWSSRDHRTELSVSLYYNTLLWHAGLTTTPSLTAKIQVTRLSLDEVGRLVVDLRTFAKFRGQFVLHHPGLEQVTSRLVAPDQLNFSLSLQLLWTAPTWDGPEQVWRATSNYTLQDYTGQYTLELIPCTAESSQPFTPSPTHTTNTTQTDTEPPACTPNPPTLFPLNLALMQTQRPVPLTYTLDTDFHLLTDMERFLADPTQHSYTQVVEEEEKKEAGQRYGPGETIYGRVWWRAGQDLPPTYTLTIQRVYVCTGADGYVPTYDPTGEVYQDGPQYGCLQPSPRLRHSFLILDRHQSELSGGEGNESGDQDGKVEAYFAEDVAELAPIHHHPATDGFLLRTDALYALNSGYQWFLQVLYTIGPSSDRIRRDKGTHTATAHPHVPSSESYSQHDDDLSPAPGQQLSEVDVTMLSQEENSFVLQNPIDENPTYPEEQNSPEELPVPEFLSALHLRNGTNMRGFQLADPTTPRSDSTLLSVLYVVTALIILLALVIAGLLLVKRHYRHTEKNKVIVVRSRKNEREEFRRKGVGGKIMERPKTLPANMTLNSESNLQTVKVKTLAITVRNNLEDEGTEV
ncbi:hypothetical protein Pcinc_034224 [Petrolisthes cinctipes]|uniref:VWFC domain-containing protein n=1 Tax=Petrolisthes cinctipes TaxID=88211 RepID=A0AAE1EQM9_PETCI|nr:hypothetical protein Pcinc_034224 [Petrolisthes cinctipes]